MNEIARLKAIHDRMGKKLEKQSRLTDEAQMGLGKIKKIIEMRNGEVRGIAKEEIMEVLDRLLLPTNHSSNTR